MKTVSKYYQNILHTPSHHNQAVTLLSGTCQLKYCQSGSPEVTLSERFYMVEGEGWHDLIKEQISAWRYNIISFSENIWERPDEVPQVVTRFGKLIVTFPIQFLPHWNMKAQLYINHSQKLLPPLGMTLHNINMKLVTAVDFSEKLEGLWSFNSGESPSCWR